MALSCSKKVINAVKRNNILVLTVWMSKYQYQKSYKTWFSMYSDLEYIIEKTDRCKNNPENSSKIKINENVPIGFWMSTISLSRSIENKHDVYRGKDCTKKFGELLREQTMKIIILKRKKWSY